MVRSTCLSHPNRPTPNTLPDLGGSEKLSGPPTGRKGRTERETGGPGDRWSVPRSPGLPLRHGVAGGVFFGSIRTIHSPFSMSFT